jgi:hypothetical protein
MHPPHTSVRQQRIEGTVLRVDIINRELTVFAGGMRVVIDVPADCRIVLRGEPVKLRMLQPLDRARVACNISDRLPIANAVEVGPGG